MTTFIAILFILLIGAVLVIPFGMYSFVGFLFARLFTGNEKEGFLLERVDFGIDSALVVSYGEYELTNKTELEELGQIFGNPVKGSINPAVGVH